MQLPPVTVICPNVSSNALGRSLLLAELLRDETDVEIVGVRQNAELWSPAQASSIPIRAYPLRSGRRHYFDAVPWLREITGDRMVIVSKPVLQSLGLALLAGAGRKRGMLIDIDDWQTGFFQRRAGDTLAPMATRWERLRSYARRGGLNGFVLTRALEEYARRRTPRIVSNRWLQNRFGGDIVYHVRDAAVLDPAIPPGSQPARLDPSLVWVGFVGTPRLHKGIDVLLRAVVDARRRAGVGLVVMGCSESESFVASAREKLRAAFVCLPPFAWPALADHVRMADVIAIPSLDVPAAWGQIPAKLFDAMAMAKPVIASALNDMPEILSEVGITVAAGDQRQLADAIVSLAGDPAKRAALGALAREKLIRLYSYDAGRTVLKRAVLAAAR
ncbi:MAG TPA: glycosyltransferase [Polyangiaceae bacterium]|nr:glycosyltransferase [Polyangiaceae bacterium]